MVRDILVYLNQIIIGEYMKKPNIFNYATSELSQDAIICYILEWAKKE